MKIEPKVVFDKTWTWPLLDWMRSALAHHSFKGEHQTTEQQLLDMAQESMLEQIHGIAQMAFNAGREYQKRNPDSE